MTPPAKSLSTAELVEYTSAIGELLEEDPDHHAQGRESEKDQGGCGLDGLDQQVDFNFAASEARLDKDHGHHPNQNKSPQMF